ncbi:MAG TPA: hypothetical protein VFZ70_17850 [Euzebyales bacterium]
MSQERTRFPITPQDRHRTALSSDDVRAVPEEKLPRKERRPQDKPLPPGATADDHGDRDDDED